MGRDVCREYMQGFALPAVGSNDVFAMRASLSLFVQESQACVCECCPFSACVSPSRSAEVSVESRVEYAYFDLGWQSFALSVRVRLYHVGVGQKRSGACAGADRRRRPPPLRRRPAAADALPSVGRQGDRPRITSYWLISY